MCPLKIGVFACQLRSNLSVRLCIMPYLFNSIDIENPSPEYYFEQHVPGQPLFLSLASGYHGKEVAACRRKIDLTCQRMTCDFACNSIKSLFIHMKCSKYKHTKHVRTT